MTAGPAPPGLRLALFTMDSPMGDAAALAFARAHRAELVLVGLSDPRRPAMGGAIGQLRRHLARSGPGILPYLALGFALPELLARLRGTAPGTLRGLCREAGIPLHRIAAVNGPGLRAALSAARPDLIVSLHFDQIFAPETLALARLGGINLHPSLLPRHRGPVPAFWGLAEGGGAGGSATGLGVTIHRLAPRIDAGEVLARRAVALPAGLSALEAARRLHVAGAPLLSETVRALAAGTAIAQPASDLLPYRPFPDRAALRDAARRGVRLARFADLRRSLSRPG